MTERWQKIADEWLGELGRLGKEWPAELQKAMGEYAETLMNEAIDPRRFMEFLRGSGESFTGFPGTPNGEVRCDPYVILGLERTATDEEIKKRYHNLVHKLHPDTAGVEGTERLFQLVLAAYEAIRRERGLR
ncbi:MAG: J domain-containing protein [Dehalococcoidales bacterium]|nr:J domain-containing protein [Dehalococcoidales bacterium]